MLNPDDKHDADHLLAMMEDAGVDVTATIMGDVVVVEAADTDGQVYRVQRDDGAHYAAVVEVMRRLGGKLG